MELDPVVLLAYVSVAVNILTVVAATVAYLIFRIRRRRRKRPMTGDSATPATFEPVFLRLYQPAEGSVATEVTEPGVGSGEGR